MNINNQAARIFLIICLVLLTGFITYLTYNNLQDRISFVKNSYQTEGTVTQIVKLYRSGGTDNGRYIYLPVITYTDNIGGTQNFQSDVGAGPLTYREGQKRTIRISKIGELPRIYELKEFWLGSLFMTVLTLIGWFMVYVGIRGGYFRKKIN